MSNDRAGHAFSARVYAYSTEYFWCSEHEAPIGIGEGFASKIDACRAAITHARELGFSHIVIRGDGATRRARAASGNSIKVTVIASKPSAGGHA